MLMIFWVGKIGFWFGEARYSDDMRERVVGSGPVGGICHMSSCVYLSHLQSFFLSTSPFF